MVISKQLFGTKMKTLIIVEFPFPINAIYYIICEPLFFFFPVIIMVSLAVELLGRSILELVSSLILSMLTPPLPMIFLWNCLKMGILTWKLDLRRSLDILVRCFYQRQPRDHKASQYQTWLQDEGKLNSYKLFSQLAYE